MASIPACHAGDRGSIPRRGDSFLSLLFSTILSTLNYYQLMVGYLECFDPDQPASSASLMLDTVAPQSIVALDFGRKLAPWFRELTLKRQLDIGNMHKDNI